MSFVWSHCQVAWLEEYAYVRALVVDLNYGFHGVGALKHVVCYLRLQFEAAVADGSKPEMHTSFSPLPESQQNQVVVVTWHGDISFVVLADDFERALVVGATYTNGTLLSAHYEVRLLQALCSRLAFAFD